MTTMTLSSFMSQRMVAVTLAMVAAIVSMSPIGTAFAQGAGPESGIYQLKLTAGGGLSLCPSPGSPPSGMSGDVSKFGPAAIFRLMFAPDHLLSVGMESGWTSVYSYETTGQDAGKVSLSQVPMYFVFAMRPWEGIQILGGYGYSRLNTSLDYQGEVNQGTWSMGWITSASYEKPIADRLALAGELKWINAIEEKQAVITFQVQLVWDFYRW
jgi:hypothetical protein